MKIISFDGKQEGFDPQAVAQKNSGSCVCEKRAGCWKSGSKAKSWFPAM